jgi:hypothetical protein
LSLPKRSGQEFTTRYEQLEYVPESEDPSLTIETARLVAKVIDNTGLLVETHPEDPRLFGKHAIHSPVPFSHHLGYHGIRTIYDRDEKRNLVSPFTSWLNLQTVEFAGIANDPVDERAWSGVGRGWPIRLERAGTAVGLTMDALPQTKLRYTIEFQPAEPDAIDFSIRFTFGRRPDAGAARFRATWPLYINAYDDVRFFYPRGDSPSRWEWASLGERPDVIIGDAVGYQHQQEAFRTESQALPLGFGRVGERAVVLMLSDPNVRFFVVNAGGHFSFFPVQNPAWDFEYVIEDYPLHQAVGFDGRLMYTRLTRPSEALAHYEDWLDTRRDTMSSG